MAQSTCFKAAALLCAVALLQITAAQDAATPGRNLLATCKADANGQIRCDSSFKPNPRPNPMPLPQPQPQPSPGPVPGPMFPSPGPFPGVGGQRIDIRGCGAMSPVAPSQLTEETVHETARSLLKDLMTECSFMAPNMLRIAFHDAGTCSLSQGKKNGANGSIRLELNEPANQSGQVARSLDILSDIQNLLASIGIRISYADLVQIAAAAAVESAGGPRYSVRLGRRDAVSPDTYGTFPGRSDNVATLLSKFQGMNLDVRDFVALSGAHTIGSQTQSSPRSFDSRHFKDIMSGNALLESDAAMMNDDRTASWVRWFADNEADFFSSFVVAMLKVGECGAVRS